MESLLFSREKICFPRNSTNTTPDDIEYTALRGNDNNPHDNHRIYWPVDDSVTCAIGAYVAACLLRLATKPASNFLNAWKHIKSRYSNINKRPILIRGLNPIEENLDSIRFTLYESPLVTNTLARFLYHFSELQGQLKWYARFAFEQHLSFTGLHSYKLFGRSSAKLKATPHDLSLALDHIMTRHGLAMINTILQSFESSTHDEQRRQTWKYARLFDEDIFVDLQTKNCSELTFILAIILTELDEKESVGDIVSILDIQNSYEKEFLIDFLNQVASSIIQQFASNRQKTWKKVG